MVASHTPPTGDLAHNSGMCPDWELNQRHFGSQAGTQSTEPHQPRPELDFLTRARAASPGEGIGKEMGVARRKHPYNSRSLVLPDKREEGGRKRNALLHVLYDPSEAHRA